MRQHNTQLVGDDNCSVAPLFYAALELRDATSFDSVGSEVSSLHFACT